jgi:hypothetical protein
VLGLLRDFSALLSHGLSCRFYSRDNGHVHRRAGKNERDRNTEGARGFVRLDSESAFLGDAVDGGTWQRFRSCYDGWRQMADDAVLLRPA